MISKEALEYLISTGQKAREVRFVGLTPDGRHARFDVAGELKEVIEPPPVRAHRVYSLADLINYVIDTASDHETVIWYSRQAVILMLDDADRRDRVTFDLRLSEIFHHLVQLHEDLDPGSLDQRGFVRLLRNLGIEAALIAPFRRLDWTTHMASVGETMPGRDRLGKDVQANVAGISDLPEDLIVSTPVYREIGERELVHVRCRIETFPLEQRLQIRPFPGEIDLAFEQAMGSISERLREGLDNQSIYYGMP